MRLWIALLLLPPALFLLDRAGLWLERRGWIYWRKRRAGGSALGPTLLELQKLFESGKSAHVIKAQRDAKAERPGSPSGKD